MIENAGRCQTALTPVLKAEGNESCGDRHLRPAPRQTGRAPLRSRAKRDGSVSASPVFLSQSKQNALIGLEAYDLNMRS